MFVRMRLTPVAAAMVTRRQPGDTRAVVGTHQVLAGSTIHEARANDFQMLGH